MVSNDQYWATPEEAALGSWPEAAQARIVDVQWLEDDVVKVHVKVGPSYDYFDYVSLSSSEWQVGSGHN